MQGEHRRGATLLRGLPTGNRVAQGPFTGESRQRLPSHMQFAVMRALTALTAKR